MYKLFIADDEAILREGIKCLLDWKEIGYEIIGEASNGKKAFEMILDKKPDLVFFDIRMPGMSGLDSIRILRQQGFTGKVIILSGYSDFTYAQEAMQYGVLCYLTKPINKEKLEEVATSIKEQLDSEQLALGTSANYKEKAYNSIMKEIVTGNADFSKLNLHELHLEHGIFQVVIHEKYNCNNNEFSYRFSDMFRVVNQNNSSFDTIINGSQEIILLKGSFALKEFEDFLSQYERESRVQENSPLDSIFLAYGRIVSSLQEVPLSYEDATRLISHRFFCEQGQHTFGYESLPRLDQCTPLITDDFLAEYTERLFDSLCAFQYHLTAKTLQELQTDLYNASDSIESIKLFFTDLFLQLKERMNRTYTNIILPFPSNADIIRQILDKNYLYEIVFFLAEQFESIISSNGNSSHSSILDDVIYYIDHNYSRNITLENIAPLFGYNSSYLGKIFNKKMGENFNSYLERIRIEHSKKLLVQDDTKIYSIAEQVGYRNVDYFYMKFKKYVGQTPAEFRKQQKEMPRA